MPRFRLVGKVRERRRMISQRVGPVAVHDVCLGIDVIPVEVIRGHQRRVGAETGTVREIGCGQMHVRPQRRIDLLSDGFA